jgi:hypothetical protein
MYHSNFNGKTLTTVPWKSTAGQAVTIPQKSTAGQADTTEKKAKGKASSSELSDRFLRKKLPNLTLSRS